MKLERNELIIQQAKEVEEERNQRRTVMSASEKLKWRVRCLEDEVQKQQLKGERKAQEVLQMANEKASIMGILKEKEIMLDSMKRQLNELREELHQKEQEIESLFNRQTQDYKDQGVQERKEKSRLQKEMEILERNYMELEQ